MTTPAWSDYNPSDLAYLREDTVFKETINRGFGTLTDEFGVVRNKVGIHTFTGEVSLSDFSPSGLGIVDDTAAFTAAMAALPNGGTIKVPPGLYAVNLALTGSNYHFVGQQRDYSREGIAGLVAFDVNSPVVQIGDGTIATSDIIFSNFNIYAKVGQTPTQGVKFYGCERCYFENCVIRNFSQYQIQLDSSAARDTAFIYFDKVSIATRAVGGSLGIDFNYGASFTTAVFISNSDISVATGGSYALDLAASCDLRMSNVWISAKNNAGIHLQSATARIKASQVMVDSNASTDTLVTCDFDTPFSIVGTIAIDGKASFTSGLTTSLTDRNYQAYHTIESYPQIQGVLGFIDTAAANNAQYPDNSVETPQKIFRDGAILHLTSSDGDIRFNPIATGFVDVFSGHLQLRTAAIAGQDTNVVVLGNAVQATVGAAGAAANVPASATGYLRFFIGNTEYVIPYFAKA